MQGIHRISWVKGCTLLIYQKESAALVGEPDKRCSILSSLEALVLNYINNFNTNKIHAIPKNQNDIQLYIKPGEQR